MDEGLRDLGRSSFKVPKFILGCGNFGGIGSDPRFFGKGESEAEANALMDAAWDAGITSFDTADAYGGGRSEQWIGAWSAATQRTPLVCTKVFHSVEGDANDFGLRPERIRRQVEGSLTRLRRDRLDLYMLHEPDPETPIEETLEVLDELVRSNKIGAIGACNVDAELLADSLAICARRGFTRFEWVQNEYNLINRGAENDVLPLCMSEGLGFTPFSPLCGGWLTGKYTRGSAPPKGSRMTMRPEPYREIENQRTYDGLEKLKTFATEREVDMATVAVAWVSSQPGVTAAVLGPRRAEHLDPALRSQELRLSKADRDFLSELF